MTKTQAGQIWSPAVFPGPEPLHKRLTDALARDVTEGRLAPGMRLPTHRDLAYRLGIGVGTVTRAYADAETVGLITSRVGRGSYVAATPSRIQADGPLDLARNLAPSGAAETFLRESLARMSRRFDVRSCLDYPPASGLENHRRAAAGWLARAGGPENADWRRLLLCAGAQQGLALTMDHLCRSADTILTEAGTFFGLRDLARHRGYHLRGVAMDQEGLAPEALERAGRETAARVLYVLPTFQNPTGRSQSLDRRREIVAVARALNLWIVEDDVYGALAPSPTAPPLAALAPERTIYVTSLSKVLGPGLRFGMVLAPDQAIFEGLCAGVRATALAPPVFGAEIAVDWIESGVADQIAGNVRRELSDRRKAALAVLGSRVEFGAAGSPHLWAPLTELEAERVALRALRAGVEVTPPSAPIVEPALMSGLRLCLGSMPDGPQLARALEVIRGAIDIGSGISDRDVV